MRARFAMVLLVVVTAAAVMTAASAFAQKSEDMAAEKMMKKAEMMETPFGGEKDVAFAKGLWKAMGGYDGWIMQSDIMPGKSPHGAFVRMYYNIVNVDNVSYHVVVKDNYGGDGVTLEMVKEDPAAYLMAVTPMVQREQGYDADNNDWFWVKYGPDGSIDVNAADVAMAGRVAKGMPKGCIACHANAGDGDYLFTND